MLFSAFAGSFKTDPDDWEECEAVRHGATVPANAFPPNEECSLLHSEGGATHVPSRPGHQRDLLR